MQEHCTTFTQAKLEDVCKQRCKALGLQRLPAYLTLDISREEDGANAQSRMNGSLLHAPPARGWWAVLTNARMNSSCLSLVGLSHQKCLLKATGRLAKHNRRTSSLRVPQLPHPASTLGSPALV
jgi:hypothetical protein